MKSLVICKCGHSNNLHNQYGCRLPSCDCKKFMPGFAPERLMDATDEQINQMPDFDELVQEQARLLFPDYDPDNFCWQKTAPDNEHCKWCYEWRRFPPGQRHFGYTWWRICDHSCECEHHKDEIWLA